MIFLSNIQGTITAIDQSPIYQGSSDANEVILIAPFPSSSTISVAFTLPNGVIINPFLAESYNMALMSGFSDKFYDAAKNRYNAWKLLLDYDLTQISGDLTVQFTVAKGYHTVNGVSKPIIQTTSSVTTTIGSGVPYLPPEFTESDWKSILAAITAANNAADRAENAAALMQWDYAITNIESFTTEKFDEFASEKGDRPFTVIVKDVNGTAPGDASEVVIPATCSEVHFSNCEIYAQIKGNRYKGVDANNQPIQVIATSQPVPTTISGFKGMYSNTTDPKISSLYYFEKVKDCSVCYVYNCQTVLNSKIHKLHVSNFFFNRADNITLYNYVEATNIELGAYAISINSLSLCQVSNVIFERNVSIHGTQTDISGGYFTISGAKGLSNVTAPNQVTIEYSNCTFADPFTCKDYANSYEGQVPVITSGGTLECKRVFSEDETKAYVSDNFLSKQEASSIYKYMGSVENYSDLPNNLGESQKGYVYNVENEYISPNGTHYPPGTNFAWTGTEWDPLGGDFSDLALLMSAFKWDHIITAPKFIESNNDLNLSGLSGNVLLSGLKTPAPVSDLAFAVPRDIKTLGFLNCDFKRTTFYGSRYNETINNTTKVIGFNNTSTQSYLSSKLQYFYEVSHLENNANVDIDSCKFVHDCMLYSNTISNCDSVCDVFGSSTISNCRQVRNIFKKSADSSITYTECTDVDVFSCSGYFKSSLHPEKYENNLKTQVHTLNGSVRMAYADTTVDYVITDITDNILITNLEGVVVYDGITIDAPNSNCVFPDTITELIFVNSFINCNLTANGNNTVIKGVKMLQSNGSTNTAPRLTGFARVENCDTVRVYNCGNVRNSRITYAKNCNTINNVVCYKRNDLDSATIEQCKNISNVICTIENEATITKAQFIGCHYLSNITKTNGTITYTDCDHVNGDTCEDYYNSQDVGKVNIITPDGTKKTEGYLKSWDHLIDSLDNFTTEYLSTLSGIVLVRGLNYQSNNGVPVKITVQVPRSVSKIIFEDCELFIDISCVVLDNTPLKTSIHGLNTISMHHSSEPNPNRSIISFFAEVSECTGKSYTNDTYTKSTGLYIYRCENVHDCNIGEGLIGLCNNVHDLTYWISGSSSDHTYHPFSSCRGLSNIVIRSLIRSLPASTVNISHCENLKGIYCLPFLVNDNGQQSSDITVVYDDCKNVSGFTCYGYYTSDDIGKVQVVTADGSKEIAYAGGSISPVVIETLNELHAGGIE